MQPSRCNHTYVCFDCMYSRRAFGNNGDCPSCGKPLIGLGSRLRIPVKDRKKWDDFKEMILDPNSSFRGSDYLKGKLMPPKEDLKVKWAQALDMMGKVAERGKFNVKGVRVWVNAKGEYCGRIGHLGAGSSDTVNLTQLLSHPVPIDLLIKEEMKSMEPKGVHPVNNTLKILILKERLGYNC